MKYQWLPLDVTESWKTLVAAVEHIESVARRTLQYRLKQLVDEGFLVKVGKRRWVKYRFPDKTGSSRGAMHTISGKESPAELPLSASFDQAFFVMVHLPYLQPFEDVNKRVSRLATNIPLI